MVNQNVPDPARRLSVSSKFVLLPMILGELPS